MTLRYVMALTMERLLLERSLMVPHASLTAPALTAGSRLFPPGPTDISGAREWRYRRCRRTPLPTFRSTARPRM